MRVDRSGGKGFISENPPSGKDSTIQKKGTKNKETVDVHQDESAAEPGDSKPDATVVSGRKEESQLTADITRKFLSAELPEELEPEKPLTAIPMFQKPPDLQISSNVSVVAKPIDPAAVPLNADLAGMPSLEFMTPEQKTTFVQQLLDRPISSESGNIINSVLMSAGGREEFSRIVDHAGGKKIPSTFENQETKILWDHLAGAYNRNDLAMNPETAAKTQGLLTGEAPELEILAPRSETPLYLQTKGDKGPVDLMMLSRGSLVCVALENAVRIEEGIPLVNPGELREKVFDILNVPEQTLEHRTVNLESLRSDINLTEYQMREIVSLPIAAALQSIVVDLEAYRDKTVLTFEKKIEEAIATYGPDSLIVEIARAEHTEFLDDIEPEINAFQELRAGALEIFSGPEDRLVKIDSDLHILLNDFMPQTGTFSGLIEKFEQGARVFEPGNLDLSLQHIGRLQIPELKNFVTQGITFFDDLSRLVPDVQVLAPELRPFHFLNHLYKGLFHQQVTEFKAAAQHFNELPAVQQSVTQLHQWRTEFPVYKAMPDRSSAVESGQKFLQDLTGEILMSRWSTLRQEVQDLRLPSKVEGLIETLRTMGDLIVSFRNGHFVQILSTLNHRMAGSPAILQIIQQALHLTNSGTGFFRGLFNREWERPLTLALKKNPGNKELVEAQTIFSDALNLFLPLESIDNLTPFLQYQRQLGILRDESLMSDRIHRHQKSWAK